MPNATLKPTEVDGRYRLTVGLSLGLYDEDGKLVGGDDPNIELTLPVAVGPKVIANGRANRFESRGAAWHISPDGWRRADAERSARQRA